MNRLMLLLVVSGLTVTMLTGCGWIEGPPSLKERRTQRAQAAKEQRAKKVAEAKSARPPKPPRPVKAPPPKPVVSPGSVKYLEHKNGFRDVVFGQQESSFTGLVLKSQDEQRGIKTFTRSNDELSLAGVPLEGIEYNFFDGQLYRIVVKWRIEQRNPELDKPAALTLAPFCANLYGRPVSRSNKKDRTELRWRGRRVELTLSEVMTRGVPDVLNGGWALPPLASGILVMEEIELRKGVSAVLASTVTARKNGL